MRNRDLRSVPAALSAAVLTVLLAMLLLSLLAVTAGAADEYNLWIDDTKVTSENCGDVLGNGAFSYDPGSKTLTIQKSYEFIPKVDKPSIRCGIKGLVIYVKNDCTLSTPHYDYNGSKYYGYTMFMLDADVTITGPGKLTLEGELLRPFCVAICVRNCRLTLTDADLFINEWYRGIAGEGVSASLTVKSTVLSIRKCYFDSPGNEGGWWYGYAVTGFQGGITLSEERLIYMSPMPEGPNEKMKMKILVMYAEKWNQEGVAIHEGMAICVGTKDDDDYGEPVDEVDLMPGYDLKINGEYVTGKNKDDVLGNGAFSYDPDSNTLFVKKSFTQTAELEKEEGLIQNRLEGLAIRTDKDCTLTADVYAVQTEADFSICGDGTLTLRVEGINASAGIRVMNNAALSVEDTRLNVYGGKLGAVCGSNTNEKLTIVNSSVYAKVEVGVNAIGYFQGGIDPGGELSEVLATPSGGMIKSGSILSSDGSVAKEVLITPGSYELWIDGTGVTPKNREDVLGNGVFSFDGVRTLTITGDYTQTKSSSLIRSSVKDLVIRVEGSSVLEAGKIGLNLQASASIEGGGDLTVLSDGASAITVSGSSTLSLTDVNLTAEGAPFALEGNGGAKLIFVDGDLTASGGTAAVSGFGGGIQAMYPLQTRIVFPEDGKFQDGAVTDSDGNPSKRAMVKTIKAFKLSIENRQVTEENMDDVLENGVFSFDGDHTLTVNGDHTADFTIIDSSISGLVIRVAKDSTLKMSDYGMGFPICCSGNTTITGPGKLTLTAVSYNSALEMLSGSLTLRDLDLTVENGNWGIQGSGTWSPGDLRIERSTVHASVNNSWNSPVTGFANGIVLSGCELVTPSDGTVKDGAIMNGDGTIPDEVLIQVTMTVEVVGSQLRYSIKLTAGDARLVAAWYDEAGRMLGCSVKDETLDSLRTGTIPVMKDQKEYRFFVLNKKGMPLTQAFSTKG